MAPIVLGGQSQAQAQLRRLLEPGRRPAASYVCNLNESLKRKVVSTEQGAPCVWPSCPAGAYCSASWLVSVSTRVISGKPVLFGQFLARKKNNKEQHLVYLFLGLFFLLFFFKIFFI